MTASFDQSRALIEGWCLMNGRDIQRDDETMAFATDDAALEFVRAKAAEGSHYHRNALRIARKGRLPLATSTNEPLVGPDYPREDHLDFGGDE